MALIQFFLASRDYVMCCSSYSYWVDGAGWLGWAGVWGRATLCMTMCECVIVIIGLCWVSWNFTSFGDKQ